MRGDDVLPVLLGLITLVGAICWGVAAGTTRRAWQFLGSVFGSVLTSIYAAEMFGWDHALSVRWVRIVSLGYLTFSMIAVPLWVAHTTAKHHEVVATAREVVDGLTSKGGS